MSAQRQWEVWLGSKASIWSHRGYQVSGETVYATSERDALRIARVSCGARLPRVKVPDDGIYIYADRETMALDDQGTLACAVIRLARKAW